MPTSVKMLAYTNQVNARNQALKQQVAPITHQLEIRWDTTVNKWVVSDPQIKLWRGLDNVEWTLVPDSLHPNVSAHFQFTDETFSDAGLNVLSKDKTASINSPGGTLTLRVRDDACRRTNPHQYAVWINECREEDGRCVNSGDFAVGEKHKNPPPEVTVGP